MITVIDNYDSFTYNLVQYLGELGQELNVVRNDATTAAEIASLKPSHVIISPGPCTPKEAGISMDVIRACGAKIPVLGVCLGHQCIGQVFGGNVIRAGHVMHGKTSRICHNDDPLFAGIENPFVATRYHSLIVERSSVPPELEIIAWTEADDIVMAMKHRELPIYGVQFHPESILTTSGKQLLSNFLALSR
jgi:anthranilate synthase/aminodeoxychorismate synthase-like glutamine amidotransferase